MCLRICPRFALCALLCGVLAVLVGALLPAFLHAEDAAPQTGSPAHGIEFEPEYIPAPGTRIRAIHIRTGEVFDVDENFIFTIGNALHWTTKESTVRRDLLYKEGDEYRQDLIDESERILRGNGCFTVERTRVVPAESAGADGSGGAAVLPGLVDIYIVTRDVWSLNFNIKGGYSGGIFTYTFMLGERNLFGRRISLEPRFERDNFFTRWGQHFDQPRLFGSHWRFFERLGFYYDNETGKHAGEKVELLLERPLFSRSEKWGWQSLFEYDNNPIVKHKGSKIDQIAMNDGTLFDRRYRDTHFILQNMILRSFGYTNKLNLGVYIQNLHYRYKANDGVGEEYEDEFRARVMKDDYTRHKIGVMFDANDHRWVRIRDFNRLGVVEDFAQGNSAKITLSTSQKVWASDENALYLNVILSNNTILGGGDQILRPSANYSADFVFGEEPRNQIVTLRYHHHFRTLPLGTLSLRAETSMGWNLDNESYFTLGADKGLRGYVADHFEGDRRVLLSAEYRFNSLPFVFNTRLAFAAFADLGSCWYTDERPPRGARDRRLYPGAGISIRLGAPFLNPDVMRFDFATNFGNERQSFGSVFSFNYGQAF